MSTWLHGRGAQGRGACGARLQQAVERRLALVGRDGVRQRQRRLIELHLQHTPRVALCCGRCNLLSVRQPAACCKRKRAGLWQPYQRENATLLSMRVWRIVIEMDRVDAKLTPIVASSCMYPAHKHVSGSAPLRAPFTSYFFTSAKRSRRKNVAQPSIAYADPV